MRSTAQSVVLALVLSLVFLVAPAYAKDWRIESMDVVLDVGASSDILVTEEVTFAFEGSYSFVGRVIPTGNLDGIDNVTVSQNGTALPVGTGPGSYSTFMEGEDLIVQLNFALQDTSATWKIHYVARGAVSYFDDVDEVVWHVFDAETPVPIDSVRVTMNLPGAVPPAELTGAVDTGPGVLNTISSPGDSTIVYEAEQIFPYTRFWIAGGFPKRVVDHPWTARRLGAFVAPKAGFALPIFTFLVMLLVWAARGRDQPAAVYARYVAEPPSNLPPAVAGALIDEKVERRELLATVADLARRGYLALPEAGGSKQVAALKLRLLKPTTDLQGVDAMVASALFPHGEETVQGASIGERLLGVAGGFEDAVFANVVRSDFFGETPEAARKTWSRRTWLYGLALLVFTVVLALKGIGGWGFFLVGSAVSIVVMAGFVRYMPQRTKAGAEEQRKWEAFRNYLRDLTRFEDVPTAKESFERFLPYAIAFGVERDWTRRFDGLGVPAPDWVTAAPAAAGGRPAQPPSAPWQPSSAGPSLGGMLPGPGRTSSGAPAAPREPITLDGLSDGLFGGLERISSAMISAPSSTGSGRGAFGSGRTTSSRSSWSSRSSSSSSRSGGWTSTSHGSSGGSSGGGFSRGGGGGGGGGGFRAG
ncbi:MAG: DUF2207 domain-containing protein [Thermoleophilia bacterium]